VACLTHRYHSPNHVPGTASVRAPGDRDVNQARNRCRLPCRKFSPARRKLRIYRCRTLWQRGFGRGNAGSAQPAAGANAGVCRHGAHGFAAAGRLRLRDFRSRGKQRSRWRIYFELRVGSERAVALLLGAYSSRSALQMEYAADIRYRSRCSAAFRVDGMVLRLPQKRTDARPVGECYLRSFSVPGVISSVRQSRCRYRCRIYLR